MVPPGPPTPLGGGQSVPPSLLRSNSGLMAGQGGAMPSQGGFPSMVSPRTQFGNMNMLGNVPNVSALLHQSFANGGPNHGLPPPESSQRGLMDNGAESDILSGVGNGMGFNQPSSPLVSSSMAGNPSGQVQGQQFPNASGNQMVTDSQHSQQHDPQNFQHNQQTMQQFSAANNTQQLQPFQSTRAGMGGVGPVKLEPQVSNEQTPQQLQALRNLSSVKHEPQIQSMRSLAQVKLEPQHTDPSLFLQQQQQQQKQQQQQQQQQHQHFLQLSRPSPQVAAAQLLHQQRLMQLQHQQQQHILKSIPPQRSSLQPQFQPQNLPIRSPAKPVYEPGMCARRLTHYMFQQQNRPDDNNIEFWRKFVSEFFAPNAKKKWCVSMYGSGRQTNGVFPQDVWHCEICNRKPGRGFEATVEVLPRLFKIKYESGTLEELLYVDMPKEYQNSSGQIVLDYAKAIQESVFEQLRVVRDGLLRIVFSPDLKICSWEFCARRHEELIPRRLLVPQVNQLGTAAQKYQAATQNASSDVSVSELQNNCNMFVASARQLAKALEVPLVNDLGYTKRYVRCLQISEVVNSMKDLIDYSRENAIGPMESLAKFPRRPNASTGFHNQQQQQPENQLMQQQQQQLQAVGQNSNNDGFVHSGAVKQASGNGISNVNNAPVAALVHQNSMNSRQQNSISTSNNPYGGNGVQLPSLGSSSNILQPQGNPSPFQSPTPSSSNNPPQTSHGGLSAGNHMNSANSPNMSIQQPALSGDADGTDSQSSVQKIIHEMMMSSQLVGGGGSGNLANDVKNVNGMLQSNSNSGLNGTNHLMGNGAANSATSGGNGGGTGFGTMGNGLGPSGMANGIRASVGNNSMSLNGRVGMTMPRDQSINQQDLGNQLLNGLGSVNGFNNLQFDWKASP